MTDQNIFKHQDEQGRKHIAAIVFWKHPRKLAHCLMQAVTMPDNSLHIWLADLRTCSRYISVGGDLVAVAEAVAERLKGIVTIEQMALANWYYRSGPYSSYDFVGYHDLSTIELSMNENGNWQERGIGKSLSKDELSALLQLTALNDVEADLQRLPAQAELEPDDH